MMKVKNYKFDKLKHLETDIDFKGVVESRKIEILKVGNDLNKFLEEKKLLLDDEALMKYLEIRYDKCNNDDSLSTDQVLSKYLEEKQALNFFINNQKEVVQNYDYAVELNKVFHYIHTAFEDKSNSQIPPGQIFFYEKEKNISSAYLASNTYICRKFNLFLLNKKYILKKSNIKHFLKINSRIYKKTTFNLYKNLLQILISQQTIYKYDYPFRKSIKELFDVFKIRQKVSNRSKKEELKYFNIDDIKRIIRQNDNIKSNLIIKFLFLTGCTISEMLNIKFKNITLSKKVKIVTKNRKYVYIEKEFYSDIFSTFQGDSWLFEHGGKPYNRSYIYSMIKKAGKKVGVKLTPRILRDSFAMHLKNRGKGAKYIADALGIKSANLVVEKYFKETFNRKITGLFYNI